MHPMPLGLPKTTAKDRTTLTPSRSKSINSGADTLAAGGGLLVTWNLLRMRRGQQARAGWGGRASGH